MANPRFRAWVAGRIAEALNIHQQAKQEKHPGLAGLAREIAINLLLRPLLPPDVGISTGKIVDSYGCESTQLDIILHDTNILPAAVFGPGFGLYPIEACLYVIEVKSTMTAKSASEVRSAAQKLAGLRPIPGVVGVPQPLGTGVQIVPATTGGGYFPNYSCFAFSTDLAPSTPLEHERERILTGIDNHHELHLCSICVAERGTSSWSRHTRCWVDRPVSDEHDEVVYFLSTLLNTLAKMRVSRPYPNVGNYLWDLQNQ